MGSSVPARKTSLPQPNRHVKTANTDTSPIWLDRLPRDVCIRIILYLHPASFQGSTTPECCSLLSLAETSNAQRLAAVAALSGRLHIPKQADFDFWSRWGAVFGEDVLELVLFTIIPQTDTLLRAPNLFRASVINLHPVLHSLTNAHQLHHLELNLVPYSNTSADETLSALRDLKLVSLTLFCDVHSVASCMFTEQSHVVTLSNFNQGLQSLKVSCFCNHKIHPTWLLLERLPHLRRIAADGQGLRNMPDSCFHLLQSIHSIALDGGDISVQTALRIGAPVSVFRSSCALDTSQLAALASCSQLEELQVCLKRGACCALPNLTRALPCLNSLHLRALSRERTVDAEYLNVLQAATNAANLRTLRLTGLRVDTGELVEVLKHLGMRLVEFETTVDEMDASQVGQMEALLEAAAKFNSKLQKFDLVSTISVGERPCHWPSVSQRAPTIRRNYERLRLRAPGLYSWSLERYLHLLEHDVLHAV